MGYTPKSVLERLAFYEEIARSGIEYTPPASFFYDTQEVIQDLIKQINDLKQQLDSHTK